MVRDTLKHRIGRYGKPHDLTDWSQLIVQGNDAEQITLLPRDYRISACRKLIRD